MREALVDLLDRFDGLLADDLDAALFQLGPQMAADFVVEPAQDVFAAIGIGF